MLRGHVRTDRRSATRGWSAWSLDQRRGSFSRSSVGRKVIHPQAVPVRLLVAYLDPGSGSMIMQAVAGGVAGFAVIGKMYWRRIKRVFVRRDVRDAG